MILWILSNTGIIINKLSDENCAHLLEYLLVMSFLCVGGVVIYLYLSLVRHGSDTQWLMMSMIGFVSSMALSVFICWGGVRLVFQSGLLGVDQCFDCLYTNGTRVSGLCDEVHICDPSSRKRIYTVDECSAATAKGIHCEVSSLCINSASQMFNFTAVVTGFFLLVLMLNAGVIFTRMIPSLFLQANERSRLV